MITALPRIAIAVHDFEGAVTTFRDVFGLPVADFSPRTAPTLGAHVAMCAPEGGSNIELMSPADPAKPLSQALQKFLDRRGEGPYALMLEAPDPDAEAVMLAERGLDVLPLMPGAGGRDVHPRSTHGVLIRVYPDNSAQVSPGESQPPGLSGIMKAIVATADASLAAEAYGKGFGLHAGPLVTDEHRGVRYVHCRAPKGGVIELVSATNPDRPFAEAIERHLKDGKGGLYAVVLQAADPPQAVALLERHGVATEEGPARALVAYGTRFLIEPRLA